jgi:hypothetical protein
MTENEYSDAAKRCAAVITQHLADNREEAIHSWVAIRLSDGGSDGNLYPSKAIAVQHQIHEHQCAYILVPPEGMSVAAAESYLKTVRQIYDSGFPLAHPDKDVIQVGDRVIRI